MASGDESVPLDPDQFDMSNATEAADFLDQLLDDSTLQYDAQSFSRYFWYGIVAVIGVFMLRNIFWKVDRILKSKSAAKNSSTASGWHTVSIRPFNIVSNISRGLLLLQASPPRASSWIIIPPIGTMVLILSYLGFLIALEFANNDVPGAQYWTSLGIRAGWLAVGQVPLLILLAGKNNLIGLVVGSSYERLNVLHRWVARSMLLMAILHLAFLDHSWTEYGVHSLEWSTDSCIPTGFATFGVLLWMNVSTLLPLRRWGYELFVLQHLLTFFGFIIAVMYHLPDTALETRTYIWISVGIYLADRLVRTRRSMWHNSMQAQATLTSFENVTKISVRGTRLRRWKPGSFVLLSIPHFGSLQSHPATILSTPSSHDGRLVFLLRAQYGFTRKLLSGSGNEKENESTQPIETYRAFVDGPYGSTQRDFAMFNTAVLIAGSTGITFILSILLDISSRISREKVPLRHLEVVWAIQHRHQIEWVADELCASLKQLNDAGIEVKLVVYVTQDIIEDQPRVEAGNDDSVHTYGSTLPYTSILAGRPCAGSIITEISSQSQGEMGVAVCGPLGMNCAVRSAVAARCFKSGSGIYLHVEGFGW